MADPNVYIIEHTPAGVEWLDKCDVPVGVDYGLVTVGHYRFDRSQAESFAKLFVHACWEAAHWTGAESERT